MLQAFSLVWYLKELCSFVPYLQLLNAELVFEQVFDEFNRVFIENCQAKPFYILEYNNKNLRLKVSYKCTWFLKRGDLLHLIVSVEAIRE